MIFCHPIAHFFHRILLTTNLSPAPSLPSSQPSSQPSSSSLQQLLSIQPSVQPSVQPLVQSSIQPSVQQPSVGLMTRMSSSNKDIFEEIEADSALVTMFNSNSNNNSNSSSNNDNDSNSNNNNDSSSNNNNTVSSSSNGEIIQSNIDEEAPSQKVSYISSFFIGLSFCNLDLKTADVTPSILDFNYRVNIYEGKKPSMQVTVMVRLYILQRFLFFNSIVKK